MTLSIEFENKFAIIPYTGKQQNPVQDQLQIRVSLSVLKWLENVVFSIERPFCSTYKICKKEIVHFLTANTVNLLLAFSSKQKTIHSGVFYWTEIHKILKRMELRLPPKDVSGMANTAFFRVKESYDFTVRKEVPPFQALLHFFRGPTIADCGSVLCASLYASVLEVVGENIFNKIFSKKALQISCKFNDGYCFKFIKSIEKNNLNRFKKGDLAYFKGVPEYPLKHPLGLYSGFHLICNGKNKAGENTFMGFGLDKPLTVNELTELMKEEFFTEPSDDQLKYLSPEDREKNTTFCDVLSKFDKNSFNPEGVITKRKINFQRIFELFIRKISEIEKNSV